MTVRTDANLNYPFVLKRATVAIGHVQVSKFPEESMGKVPLTGHDSGGKAESMPDGIEDYTPFEGTLVPADGVLHTIRSDFKNKTVSTWSLDNGIDECTFSGWVMSLKQPDADGAKPDAIKWIFSIQPTGGLTWNPS